MLFRLLLLLAAASSPCLGVVRQTGNLITSSDLYLLEVGLPNSLYCQLPDLTQRVEECKSVFDFSEKIPFKNSNDTSKSLMAAIFFL